jgi:hypothetical protein
MRRGGARQYLRRIALAAFAAAAGVAAPAWWAIAQQGQPPAPPVVQPPPPPADAVKPTAAPVATAPATHPATQAATQPATTQAVATRPAATQTVTAAFAADVRQFGARGDGATDDTAAFAAALDAAARAGGGAAFVPAGKYLIASHLTVPSGVTLLGTSRAPAAGKSPADAGSVLLAVEGAGREKGTPFVTLASGATLQGVTVFYPNQRPDQITPYPYCVAGAGENVAVIDCVLVNPYQGIDLGSAPSARHLVRNVLGQPLRRGIYVDKCYEAGRIENVNFGAVWNWDEKSGIQSWMAQHGEAFVIARTDGQGVRDTFCYGYKVGYRFIASPDGSASGSLVGIGADASSVAFLVEAGQPGGGLLVSNGQFVSFTGDKPAQVVTFETFAGNVQFQNCAFWGAARQVARLNGPGAVSFANCSFADWGNGLAAIDLSGGNLIVTGSSFGKAQPQALVQNKAQSAAFVGNRFAGPTNIGNPANAILQVGLNVEPKPAPAPTPAVPAAK